MYIWESHWNIRKGDYWRWTIRRQRRVTLDWRGRGALERPDSGGEDQVGVRGGRHSGYITTMNTHRRLYKFVTENRFSTEKSGLRSTAAAEAVRTPLRWTLGPRLYWCRVARVQGERGGKSANKRTQFCLWPELTSSRWSLMMAWWSGLLVAEEGAPSWLDPTQVE